MNASVPGQCHAGLDEMARRVIDANLYLTLGTQDPGGSPRLSPVFYTAARYTDFYWVSAPAAQHSRNLAERPQVQIVIFDSAAGVGRGEAVYITAAARQVQAHELGAVCPEAFRAVPGVRQLQPDELCGDAAIRLYVARASSWEVHIPGRHTVQGRGVDTRQPANPASA